MLSPFKTSGAFRRRQAGWPGVLAGGILLLTTVAPVLGQEALRVSLAGQDAAEARKRALESTSYNLKLGPLKLRFQSGLAVAATDNVNLSDQNPKFDISLRPELNILTFWRATEQNALTFSAGVGYEKYLNSPDLDHAFITPGSDLAFSLYVKDFVFTLHDRMSLTENAYSQPEISGTGNFGYFENTAGLEVAWDLNKVVISASYDHVVNVATTTNFSYRDHSSELVSTRVAYSLNPTTQTGIEIGGGLTTYDRQMTTNSPALSDTTYYNAGLFFRSQFTPYLMLKASAGYTTYHLDKPPVFAPSADISAYYVNLYLQHRVNTKLTYIMEVGRSIQLGIFSDTLDLYYARIQPTWRIIRNITLRTPLFIEHATQSISSGGSEQIDRYGGGVEAAYQLTRKLNLSTSYSFGKKQSNKFGRNYVQNRLVLDLNYSF